MNPLWKGGHGGGEETAAVMAIDPSGRGADETTYAVVKQLHGTLFTTALGGLSGGYDEETLIKLAKVAREQKVNKIIIEANFGDGMFTKLFLPILARYWNCAVEEVKHHTQKEKRIIDTLEPVMNRHKLVIDLQIVKKDVQDTMLLDERLNYSLLYQMTRITRERGSLRHDDKIDVLAMAVGYWVEAMARDEELALQDYKENMIKDALEEFMAYVVGNNKFTNFDDLRFKNW